jgi:hypothetical protein
MKNIVKSEKDLRSTNEKMHAEFYNEELQYETEGRGRLKTASVFGVIHVKRTFLCRDQGDTHIGYLAHNLISSKILISTKRKSLNPQRVHHNDYISTRRI